MSEFQKKLLFNSVLGLIIAAAVVSFGGLFQAESARDVFRILSDGFFVAAAMLLGMGGLVWTYNGGVLDGLGYSVKTLFSRMTRDFEKNKVSFAEYREQREKKASSPKAMLVVGAILMVIAVIFLLVYMNIG